MSGLYQAFAIANRSTMCSTLIGGYWTTNDERSIIQSLKIQIKNAEDVNNKEQFYNPWEENNLGQRQKLDKYRVSSFAFLTGTIIDGKGIGTFKKLGFHVSETQEYNQKNDTRVHLVYISVRELVKVLKLYNDEGFPISKNEEEETACAG